MVPKNLPLFSRSAIDNFELHIAMMIDPNPSLRLRGLGVIVIPDLFGSYSFSTGICRFVESKYFFFFSSHYFFSFHSQGFPYSRSGSFGIFLSFINHCSPVQQFLSLNITSFLLWLSIPIQSFAFCIAGSG
jgi:hypothetical protein